MPIADEDTTGFDGQIVEQIPQALRFATRLCGNPHDAEDVVQEALLRASRARASFRGDSKLSTWLTRIMINAFRDWLAARDVADQTLPDDSRDERTADPAREIEANEFGRIVAQFVSQLPPRQREVLVLIAYESLSIADAAQVLGMSAQNVRTTLHMAREKMRVKLARYAK